MASKQKTGHSGTYSRAILNEIRKLQSDRNYRDQHGRFYVEGVRNFIHASESNYEFDRIFYSERLLTSSAARKEIRYCQQLGIPVQHVSPEAFRKFSTTERASGIGAIVKQRWTRLTCCVPNSALCWIILGEVRNPGNLGTLIRTSEAIGGAGFILLDRQVDPYDPIVVRASMGAIYRQSLVRTNIKALRKWVAKHACPVIGASPDGSQELHHFNYNNTKLIMLGEERHGLTQQQRSLCDHLLHIPMVGRADSLNLGVAGSLIMYEVYRVANRS